VLLAEVTNFISIV